MAFAKNIMTGGLSAGQADAIAGSVASITATAAGTQATALLVSADINVVALSSGSAAVRLYAGQPGDSCIIYNVGPSVMFVWPPSGCAILGTATNAAVTIPVAAGYTYSVVSTTTWIAPGGNTA